ncbi:MAG: hypothetical protein EYC69_11600 [Bacteroidetes bacterium]|nr:MAG: hypothetical protein EYC69_11600 [Bacteroidota bacterium]
MYKLLREQFLPISVDKAWDFFSSPANLARITPPGMGFKIISGADDPVMKEGQIIEYIVKPLFRIPLRWKTKILDVNKPASFKDIQLAGPYTNWEHRHRFIPVEGGVRMQDEVYYTLPFGILGRFMHRLFIRKKIESIFDYRFTILQKIFVG